MVSLTFFFEPLFFFLLESSNSKSTYNFDVMISLVSSRLLPHPRAVTAAAERGGGRSGFAGRSLTKRGGGRGGGGSKSSRGGSSSGGGGRGSGSSGGRKTDGNIGTRVPSPQKTINDAADPPEVSNEPSLLSSPMEVRSEWRERVFSVLAVRERCQMLLKLHFALMTTSNLKKNLPKKIRSSSSSATRPPRQPSPLSGTLFAAPASEPGRESRRPSPR